MIHRPALTTLALVGFIGLPCMGQSLDQRINQLSNTIEQGIEDDALYVDAQTGEAVRVATPRQLLRETMTRVDFDAMPGRLALEVWSNQTGVPLVVNWAALEAEGIDVETPITLKLNRVPAEQVLRLLVQQVHADPIGDDRLIIEVQQWYVRVMTRREALRRSTTKMYFIGDLLMQIPNFDNAPGFDLNDALSNTNSGGSNGGGGGNGNTQLFNDDNDDNDEAPQLSKEEKAERIADVIRDSIEPEIWRANGGEYASVRYFRGMLIVKAPQFVHDQIGVPVTGGAAERRASSSRRDRQNNNDTQQPQRRRSTSGNVAGVAPSGPRTVR